jgi:hypothetical protein
MQVSMAMTIRLCVAHRDRRQSDEQRSEIPPEKLASITGGGFVRDFRAGFMETLRDFWRGFWH